MQTATMNQEHTQVDLSQIQALQQKRTLAFVNHFVMTNVQFLNNFMKNCEQKLMAFERKIERVNAAMVLLETRLSSIPELNTIPSTTEVKETPTAEPVNEQSPEQSKETIQVEPVSEQTDGIEKPQRPEYDRFVKMVQVGVPVQAVKLKVSLEGLDPDVLDEILAK